MGHIFQGGQMLRGWSEYLKDLIRNPARAHASMERLARAHMDAFDRYCEKGSRNLDVIELTDDLGMQDKTGISPTMYRELIKPHQVRLYRHIKRKSRLRLALHSRGSAYALIPDLIEIGD
jgi:uroporphyrinogen decarboxylase